MDRRIKFRHLEVFVEIARRRSFKDAAAQLNLTQPAISKSIAELERILGTSLFDRDRGGVRPTRAGDLFLGFAEQSLAALQHGLNTVQDAERGPEARLSVGALPSVAAKLLPDAATRFLDRAPQTVLHVEQGPHAYLVHRMRAGDLDLVVGRLGPSQSMSGLSFTQLYSEHVVFAVAADHPLAGSSDLAAVARALVLFPSAQAAIRPLVERFMIANGIGDFPHRVETVSGAFGRALTLGPSRAIWIISHGVVAGDIAAGRMRVLPIDMDLTTGPVGIMARAEEDPTPAARLFRQALTDSAVALRSAI